MPTASGKSPSPLLTALRQGTGPCHKALEDRLPFFDPRFDRPAYQRLIAAYYGFHAPLEQALAGFLPALEPQRRAKAPALVTDLRNLGLTPTQIDALPLCTALPPVTDQAQALGVMYVLEGSTLGGQVLKRAMAERLDIGAGNGGAFLDVYGPETGSLWRGFLQFLEQAPGSPADQARVAQAAIDTFTGFERWLERREVLL
ncbi:MAG TPA: biliverdin-producing heme oxygenase [Pseudomonas sp.]|uniref:biliverdin-producing heme oxygenase n=1 Tax=Pseudomonas sp. TaxID=306 RepID=UPI002B4A6095|nr:biliverdin-producing heme oxygenase [Pseudomonas sp.]HKS13123.1 biliverdin-producing heme oxygenase [Pseudomonas sp.]